MPLFVFDQYDIGLDQEQAVADDAGCSAEHRAELRHIHFMRQWRIDDWIAVIRL